MQRDKAEYGLRLYQGGAVPDKEIKIVDMGEWDVEACGGVPYFGQGGGSIDRFHDSKDAMIKAVKAQLGA
ncbi:MAG: hypothetical protein NWE89_04525 [Candidatus Bathyarchaeota archaeon]|nr:hypothetical protein [Candidatus Bathyarchaeota archaeon]